MSDTAKRVVVRRTFARLDKAIVDTFARLSTAVVADARGGAGALDPAIDAVDPGARLAGSALPIQLGARDLRAALVAVESLQPGDVMVIAAGLTSTAAVMGEHLATLAHRRGAVGVVTDGRARDIDALLRLGMPIFCRGTASNAAGEDGPGQVGLPVAIGDVLIEPGDLVLGDRDGVVIVPRGEADAVLKKVRDVEALEAQLGQKIGTGEIKSLLRFLYPDAGRTIDYID
jgi:4-hydroxy-4-methyl-2-oxoglutarate aldolase